MNGLTGVPAHFAAMSDRLLGIRLYPVTQRKCDEWISSAGIAHQETVEALDIKPDGTYVMYDIWWRWT